MPIPPPGWPDLRVDQESWNEAKQRLGPDACPSELARAAQSVKAAHTNGEQALPPSTGARRYQMGLRETAVAHRSWPLLT
jgi:hypothetical protein